MDRSPGSPLPTAMWAYRRRRGHRALHRMAMWAYAARMDKRVLFSPTEIARSISELFLRSGQWLLWLLTVVVAGAIGLGERFSVHNISNHTWFRVATVGAVVSLAVAYHRARLEREAARAGDVRDDHLSELQGWLAGVIGNVTNEEVCAYGEPSGPNEAAFRAHYSDIAGTLTAWDDAVDRLRLAGNALDDRMAHAAKAAGIDDSVYSGKEVLLVLRRFVVGRLKRGELGQPFTPTWTTEGPYPGFTGDERDETLFVKVEGVSIASLKVRMGGDWAAQIDAIKPPVEQLFGESGGWGETLELAEGQAEVAALQTLLLGELEHWKKATGVRVKRSCSICRKNEGWREPMPSFWQRARERVQGRHAT